MINRRRALKLVAAGALVAALPLPALAEGWPTYGGKGRVTIERELGHRIIFWQYDDGVKKMGLGFITTRHAMRTTDWRKNEAKMMLQLRRACEQGLAVPC